MFALSGVSQAAERDFIGIPYTQQSYPLCQKYGCNFLGEQKFTDPDEAFVSLQLSRLDAKVVLSLTPQKTIMAIYTVVAGEKLSAQGAAYLQKVLIKSANEDFAPYVLPECFAKLRPQTGDYYIKGTILKDDHYGVHCLRKREKGKHYWGVWVYFDR